MFRWKYVKSLASFTKGYYTHKSNQYFSVVLELDYRCNAKCGYCDRWKDESGEHLSLEEITGLIKDLKENGNKFALALTGGEPFLVKDIREIITTILDNDIELVINSNGYLLDRHTDFINANMGRIHSLNISLDSFRAEEHDAVRLVPGGFDRIVRAIKKIHRKEKILLMATTTNKTLFTIKNYLKFADDLGVQFRMQPIHDDPANLFNVNKELKFADFDLEKLLSFYNELAEDQKLSFPERYYLKMIPLFIADPSIFKTLRCMSAGRFIYHVSPTGEVAVCEARRDVKIGNIRQTPLSEILNNENLLAWRKRTKEGKHGCSCVYGCVVFKNIYLNYFPLLGDPKMGFPVAGMWTKWFDKTTARIRAFHLKQQSAEAGKDKNKDNESEKTARAAVGG